MPRRKTQFVNGEFYHIIKKGIEEREIFLDEEDRLRFVSSLLVFNDKNPVPWQSRIFWHQREPESLPGQDYKPNSPLVEIHVFALMSNHFHLLVRQIIENGIVSLMNKLGGYSYYFNKKYGRVGPLFQGRFKAILVENELQLRSNFVYINTNPVGVIEPGWKNFKVENPQKAIQFLEKGYHWSSYRDYLGERIFSPVINKEFFLKLFGGEEEIKKEVNSWISFKANLDPLKDTTLE